MVMDILLDKFNQKLFDLLKDNEKTIIIHFVQNMKLENTLLSYLLKLNTTRDLKVTIDLVLMLVVQMSYKKNSNFSLPL
jgi:hypothetical protein